MAGSPATAGTRGAATSAPAVADSIGGSVFPAASAGIMAGAPATAGTRGAATTAPAVPGGVGGSVFPAASAGMMAGAPAAAGSRGASLAVASGSGGNAFPAKSAGMMTGTPAAAGSSGAAFQADSTAVRPPPAVAFASDVPRGLSSTSHRDRNAPASVRGDASDDTVQVTVELSV